MTHSWRRVAGVAVLGLLPQALAADTIDIQHEPVTCVPFDQYARIVAVGRPAEGVASAELQFRSDPSGAWYSTSMRVEDGAWTGVLPRSSQSLSRLEYRIVMTGSDVEATVTPPIGVVVSHDPAACASDARASVSSSIVVRVPPGAPIVPPVPAGFNPAGVVEAQERQPPKSRKTFVILGSLGAAGAIAGAVAAGASDSPPPALKVPGFEFEYAYPPPGSTLSIKNDTLNVSLKLIWEHDRPLTFTWRLELAPAAGARACAEIGGFFDLFASGFAGSANVLLMGPIQASGACGERFSVQVGRLSITFEGRIVWDANLTLPYQFEP